MTKKRQNQPKPSKGSTFADTSDEETNVFEKSCTHVSRGINLGRIKKSLKLDPNMLSCNGCVADADSDLQEVWLCLQCGYRGCGRTSENKHGLQHFKTIHSDCHSLVMSTTSGVVWCYDCDNVLSLQASRNLKQCVEFLLKQIPKFESKSISLDKNKLEAISSINDNDSTEKALDTTQRKSVKNNKEICSNSCVKGLRNLGNTCFFNAVMQNLNQTALFVHVLEDICSPTYIFSVPVLTPSENDIKVKKETINLNLPKHMPLTNSLLKFFEQMNSGTSMKNEVVNPSSLFKEISKKCPQFRNFQEQDSHELLRQLLDGVRQEEIKRQKKGILRHFDLESATPENVDDETKKLMKAYGLYASHTVIERVFGGLLISTVLCEECKTASQVFEPFMDLSLPLFEEKQQENNEQVYAMLDGGKQDNNKPSRNKKMDWVADDNGGEYALHKPEITQPTKLSKQQERKLKKLARRKSGNKNARNKRNDIVLEEGDCNMHEKEEVENEHISDVPAEDNMIKNKSLLSDDMNISENQICIVGNDSSKEHLSCDESSKQPISESKNEDVFNERVVNQSEYCVDIIQNDSYKECYDSDDEKHKIDKTENEKHKTIVNGNNLSHEEPDEYLNGGVTSAMCKINGAVCNTLDDTSICQSREMDEDSFICLKDEKQLCKSVKLNHCEFKENGLNVDENCVNIENSIVNIENHNVNIETNDVNIEENNVSRNANNGNFEVNNTNSEICKVNDSKENGDGGNSCKMTNKEYGKINGQIHESIENILPNINKLQISDDCLLENDRKEDLLPEMSSKHCSITFSKPCENSENTELRNGESNSCESDTYETSKSVRTSSKSSIEDTFSCEPSENQIYSVPDEKTQEWISKSLSTLKPRYHVCPLECSVNSCLSHFTKLELLTGSNKFRCERCTELRVKKTGNKKDVVYTNASKQLLIFSPPAVLTLHLKRFQQVGMSLRKVNRFVEFPLILDLAPFCNSACTMLPHMSSVDDEVLYSLYGIVEHSGRLSSGHYTAYVKTCKITINRTFECSLPLQQCNLEQFMYRISGISSSANNSSSEISSNDVRWFYISDANVKEVSEAQVLKCQAYLLFYERIK